MACLSLIKNGIMFINNQYRPISKNESKRESKQV